MLEIIGTVISYTYQLAVILFVLLQFGYIRPNEQKQTAVPKEPKNPREGMKNVMEMFTPFYGTIWETYAKKYIYR